MILTKVVLALYFYRGGKSGYQLGDWILPDGCDFLTCAESSFEEMLRNMKTRFSGTVGVSSDCSNG